MGIEVRTLGAVRVTRDGEEIVGLSAQRVRLAVLVYLGVERERSRDALLGLLWPEREQEKARHALNQTVYELRRVLGTEWLEAEGDRLRVSNLVVGDVPAFEEAVRAGTHARALDLYRGPFLDGFHLADTSEFEAWVDGVRGRCARLFRDVSRAALTHHLAVADMTGALNVAQRWVDFEPLDDEAHCRLITLLAEAGRRADAVRQFEAYEGLLGQDGLVPVPELRELIAQIRAGDVDVPGPAVALWRQAPGARADLTKARRETLELGSSQPVGPRLVRILDSGLEGEAFLLQSESNVIGRTEGNLLFPEDALMSAVHAEISVRVLTRDGGDSVRQFFVRDAGSRNGVYIRIRDEWPLHEGDQFAVGRQVYRFERVGVRG